MLRPAAAQKLRESMRFRKLVDDLSPGKYLAFGRNREAHLLARNSFTCRATEFRDRGLFAGTH
jgi:hypothetical protein